MVLPRSRQCYIRGKARLQQSATISSRPSYPIFSRPRTDPCRLCSRALAPPPVRAPPVAVSPPRRARRDSVAPRACPSPTHASPGRRRTTSSSSGTWWCSGRRRAQRRQSDPCEPATNVRVSACSRRRRPACGWRRRTWGQRRQPRRSWTRTLRSGWRRTGCPTHTGNTRRFWVMRTAGRRAGASSSRTRRRSTMSFKYSNVIVQSWVSGSASGRPAKYHGVGTCRG